MWAGAVNGSYGALPGYDPVAQAASGIMVRYGSLAEPKMHALASCADYITGALAAAGIAAALVARKRGGGGLHVRTSLCHGVDLVQFLFATSASKGGEPSGLQAKGESVGQHLYRALRGEWVFVGCRPSDEAKLAEALGASQPTVEHVARAIAALSFELVTQRLAALPGASAVRVTSLAQIRQARTEDKSEGAPHKAWDGSGSFRLHRQADHPSGHAVTVPLPTWIRPELSTVSRLTPQHAPGAHTKEVLLEAGISQASLAEMLREGAVSESWAALTPGRERYLPL